MPSFVVSIIDCAAHEYLKETEFSLTTLAKSQLGETRKDMTGQELEESYGSARGLHTCLETSTADALLTLKLMFHLSGSFMQRLALCEASHWCSDPSDQAADQFEWKSVE